MSKKTLTIDTKTTKVQGKVTAADEGTFTLEKFKFFFPVKLLNKKQITVGKECTVIFEKREGGKNTIKNGQILLIDYPNHIYKAAGAEEEKEVYLTIIKGKIVAIQDKRKLNYIFPN
jgi:hypothetical protein